MPGGGDSTTWREIVVTHCQLNMNARERDGSG